MLLQRQVVTQHTRTHANTQTHTDTHTQSELREARAAAMAGGEPGTPLMMGGGSAASGSMAGVCVYVCVCV